MKPGEFPHSEIRGSMLICSSPQLIAAYHVFLRLPVPRHSPCALLRLTNLQSLDRSLSLLYSNCQRNNSLPFETVVSSLEVYFFVFAVIIQFSRYISLSSLCRALKIEQYRSLVSEPTEESFQELLQPDSLERR